MSDRHEVVLGGGRANAGRVVRIGDQVARPTYPQTPFVDDFLRHLIASGIEFVPEPLGTDEQGRQRLRFLPGRVAAAPLPAWAFDERLLLSVAEHQRRLHHAAETYRAAGDAIWAVSAGDYFPDDATGALVCHNDLGVTNIVVDERRAQVAGVIDFDYCRPVDRLFDIAVAARHWVPFGDLDVDEPYALDRLERFRAFCAGHDLTRSERERVVELAAAFLEKARRNVRSLADAGNRGFIALIEAGYDETNRATLGWLAANRRELSR